MKKIVEKDVEKELESIYGIENCKGEIIDYDFFYCIIVNFYFLEFTQLFRYTLYFMHTLILLFFLLVSNILKQPSVFC